MNARTHQAYLTADLWRALQHIAVARGVCVEEALEDIAWSHISANYPCLIHATANRADWLKQHDASVRDTIKKAIETKAKA